MHGPLKRSPNGKISPNLVTLEVANALAYYDTATITVVKGFMVQAPGANVIKLFLSVIYELS